MDRGAWQAPVNGVARVRHNLATTLEPGPMPDLCLSGPPTLGCMERKCQDPGEGSCEGTGCRALEIEYQCW